MIELSRVALRAAGPDDEPFLFRVYASGREEELAVTGWNEAQKLAFLEMQYRAQSASYRANLKAWYDVIAVDGRDAGRVLVNRTESEVSVADIGLLPEYRNQGIGGTLMRGVLDEAARAGSPSGSTSSNSTPPSASIRGSASCRSASVGSTSTWRGPRRPSDRRDRMSPRTKPPHGRARGSVVGYFGPWEDVHGVELQRRANPAHRTGRTRTPAPGGSKAPAPSEPERPPFVRLGTASRGTRPGCRTSSRPRSDLSKGTLHNRRSTPPRSPNPRRGSQPPHRPGVPGAGRPGLERTRDPQLTPIRPPAAGADCRSPSSPARPCGAWRGPYRSRGSPRARRP